MLNLGCKCIKASGTLLFKPFSFIVETRIHRPWASVNSFRNRGHSRLCLGANHTGNNHLNSMSVRRPPNAEVRYSIFLFKCLWLSRGCLFEIFKTAALNRVFWWQARQKQRLCSNPSPANIRHVPAPMTRHLPYRYKLYRYVYVGLLFYIWTTPVWGKLASAGMTTCSRWLPGLVDGAVPCRAISVLFLHTHKLSDR